MRLAQRRRLLVDLRPALLSSPAARRSSVFLAKAQPMKELTPFLCTLFVYVQSSASTDRLLGYHLHLRQELSNLLGKVLDFLKRTVGHANNPIRWSLMVRHNLLLFADKVEMHENALHLGRSMRSAAELFGTVALKLLHYLPYDPSVLSAVLSVGRPSAMELALETSFHRLLAHHVVLYHIRTLWYGALSAPMSQAERTRICLGKRRRQLGGQKRGFLPTR